MKYRYFRTSYFNLVYENHVLTIAIFKKMQIIINKVDKIDLNYF